MMQKRSRGCDITKVIKVMQEEGGSTGSKLRSL